MEDQLPRKLAAILYADVAGYSRLTGLDEAGTHRRLSVRLDLIAQRVGNTGGRVVHYAGDAVLAQFDSVVSAISCALGVQRAIAALNADDPEDRRVLFRIGVNLGDVIVDRDDIYGDGVNLAARLESLAEPGGICVSAAVHEQVEGKVDLRFEDLGERTLKNIEHPVRVFHGLVKPGPRAGVERIAAFSAASNVVALSRERPESSDHDQSLDFRVSDQPVIMMLPFENLSDDAQHAALADGLRLSIHSVLVKLSGLFLFDAGAATLFRNSGISAIQAGNEAGVQYVLEGVVQISGNRIRITVTLSDAPAARVVWTERYDRVLDDIFDLQDEITTEVVTALDLKLRESDTLPELAWWEGLPDWRTREKVLQGLSYLYEGGEKNNTLARRLFEQVAAVAPATGQAFGLVALTHWVDLFGGWTDTPERSMQLGGEHAEQAIGLGDVDGLGNLVLGYVRLFEGRHDEALERTDQARLRRASCPAAVGVHAAVLLYSGNPQEALAEARTGLRIARIYPPWMVNVLAGAHRDAEEIESSIVVARESIRVDPADHHGRVILCSNLGLSGALADARDAASDILRLKPDFSVGAYARTQPYKNHDSLAPVLSALQTAGLPD